MRQLFLMEGLPDWKSWSMTAFGFCSLMLARVKTEGFQKLLLFLIFLLLFFF